MRVHLGKQHSICRRSSLKVTCAATRLRHTTNKLPDRNWVQNKQPMTQVNIWWSYCTGKTLNDVVALNQLPSKPEIYPSKIGVSCPSCGGYVRFLPLTSVVGISMFTDETRLCCILLGRPFPLTHLFQVHKGHRYIYRSAFVLRLYSNLVCLRMLVQSTVRQALRWRSQLFQNKPFILHPI